MGFFLSNLKTEKFSMIFLKTKAEGDLRTFLQGF